MGLIKTVYEEVKSTETKCGCGHVTYGLPPVGFKIANIGCPFLQGIWFDCACGSTHFIPVKADLRGMVDVMKKTVASVLIAFALSACGDESAQVSTGVVMNDTPAPESSPTPSPSSSTTTSTTTSSTTTTTQPAPYAFGGGSGTQASPYELETAADVSHIKDFPSAYFSLMNDINMAGVAFEPIATFSGTIYGNTKQIQNLTVNTTGSAVAAFVGTLSGTLVQINFRDVNFAGAQWAALVDRVGATGMISSCLLDGDMVSPSGGNGYNSGTGNPVFKSKHSSGQVLGFGPNALQNGNVDVMFNGNRVTILCSGAMCGSAGL